MANQIPDDALYAIEEVVHRYPKGFVTQGVGALIVEHAGGADAVDRGPDRCLKLGDMEGAQADIAAGKTSKARVGSRGGATTGGEGVAARTMSTLHAIFEHAVRLGQIEANPAKGVRKLASVPRERRLSRNEIERLGKTLRAVAEEGEHSTALAAIRFLLLTGFRRMEALGLQRAWLDEEEEAIRFPDTKSGAQTRVIGRAAVDLLCISMDLT